MCEVLQKAAKGQKEAVEKKAIKLAMATLSKGSSDVGEDCEVSSATASDFLSASQLARGAVSTVDVP